MSDINPFQGVSLKDIPKILPQLSMTDKEQLLAQLTKLEKLNTKELARSKFIEFVNMMWPTFISGRHHLIVAEAFERVARGELKRLIINMPPRHTKSEFGSFLLPAWLLGLFPDKKVIQASNTADLAVGFGRKVRNLVDTEEYKAIFPELRLSADSKAAGRWNTAQGGDYFAIGAGGTVTGKGADLFIIDDPHSEQEAALAETNPAIYDKVYEWYTSGPRQRLQPNGAIVIIMCMTGDTGVLRPDGNTTPLRDIRPGDEVATYEDGGLATAKVNNFRSNGVDSIYKVQTQSGRILRANKRHPFLVNDNGVEKWIRLKNLKVGDSLVSLKDVVGLGGQKLNRGFVGRAKPTKATTGKTQMHHTALLATTVSIKVSSALKRVVMHLSTVMGSAPATMGGHTGLQVGVDRHPKKSGHIELNAGMVSLWKNMMHCLRSKTVSVLSVNSPPLATTPALIGATSYVSTTATTQTRLGHFSAMTATLPWDTQRLKKQPWPSQNTSVFTLDEIVSITPDGEEEVFDVEIERTENFIANGVVSHNTRWSKRDLTGQVLKAAAQRGGDDWEVIEFPAILPGGKALWPQYWQLDELEALRDELPNSKWMAQYQQSPTSDSAAIVKREWWKRWDNPDPPACEFLLMSWDTAFEKNNRADYSAMTVWGVFRQIDTNGVMQPHLMLLDAFRDRMEFPTLKAEVLAQQKKWLPDSIIIEKKASGSPLIYELRSLGVPVQDFTPTRGNDKIARLNAVSDLFASGMVWAPDKAWAEAVIDEVASFPAGDHDDFVDSVSMALMRFRKGGFIRIPSDYDYDPPKPNFPGKGARRGYY